MLKFKSLENSHLIVVDNVCYTISDIEIDNVWWETEELLNQDHMGSAIINLGGTSVVMAENDWVHLHKETENYIQNQIAMDEILDTVVIH